MYSTVLPSRRMESTAFQHEYHKLHVGIRNGVEHLAIEAYSKDLVCEQVKNKVTSTADQDKRATAFLDAVKDRIRANSRAFYKFVELLREQAVYQSLAESLEERMHPSPVAESSREDAAPRRDMPAHGEHLPSSWRKESIPGERSVLPFLSQPLQRRDIDSGTLPRPLPNQKAEPHPLAMDPSSFNSPESSLSSVSTDSEDSLSEFSPFSGSAEVTVRTTAPTPVTEQSVAGPGGKPPVQPGTTKDSSQGQNKLTVTIPQRTNSTDSNDFMTPPTSPQPSPIQESSTEGTSTTALAGGDYSHPRTYHHTRKITELEEKLSRTTTLLEQKEKELHVAEDTIRTLKSDKKSRENKKTLREMQSRLEKTERRCGALQAERDSSYLTNEALQMKITELERKLDLLDAKACAYDEIRKNRTLEGRLEELQMTLDRMEVHCDCMRSH